MPYTEGFKARMVARMSGPEAISATALAREVGVTQPTLSRWLRERRLAVMKSNAPKRRRSWSPQEKLRVVYEASQIEDAKLGEFLRREGLREEQLKEWIGAALQGLAPPKRSRSRKTPEQKRIKELERELRRKEKALAEVAALLALKKKVDAIWGDGDDDTDTRSAT